MNSVTCSSPYTVSSGVKDRLDLDSYLRKLKLRRTLSTMIVFSIYYMSSNIVNIGCNNNYFISMIAFGNILLYVIRSNIFSREHGYIIYIVYKVNYMRLRSPYLL